MTFVEAVRRCEPDPDPVRLGNPLLPKLVPFGSDVLVEEK